MKAVKSTGLVPATYLKASGSVAKGEVRGLSPREFKILRDKGVVAAADEDSELEYTDIDDTTLEEVGAVPVPSLGGYDHFPPLASDRVAGRNRFIENRDVDTELDKARTVTYEDDALGRQPAEQQEAKPASTAQEAKQKAKSSAPPAPSASTGD